MHSQKTQSKIKMQKYTKMSTETKTNTTFMKMRYSNIGRHNFQWSFAVTRWRKPSSISCLIWTLASLRAHILCIPCGIRKLKASRCTVCTALTYTSDLNSATLFLLTFVKRNRGSSFPFCLLSFFLSLESLKLGCGIVFSEIELACELILGSLCKVWAGF